MASRLLRRFLGHALLRCVHLPRSLRHRFSGLRGLRRQARYAGGLARLQLLGQLIGLLSQRALLLGQRTHFARLGRSTGQVLLTLDELADLCDLLQQRVVALAGRRVGIAFRLLLASDDRLQLLLHRFETLDLLLSLVKLVRPFEEQPQESLKIGGDFLLLIRRISELGLLEVLRDFFHSLSQQHPTGGAERLHQLRTLFGIALAKRLAQLKHPIFQPGDAVLNDALLLDDSDLVPSCGRGSRLLAGERRGACENQQRHDPRY